MFCGDGFLFEARSEERERSDLSDHLTNVERGADTCESLAQLADISALFSSIRFPLASGTEKKVKAYAVRALPGFGE